MPSSPLFHASTTSDEPSLNEYGSEPVWNDDAKIFCFDFVPPTSLPSTTFASAKSLPTYCTFIVAPSCAFRAHFFGSNVVFTKNSTDSAGGCGASSGAGGLASASRAASICVFHDATIVSSWVIFSKASL